MATTMAPPSTSTSSVLFLRRLPSPTPPAAGRCCPAPRASAPRACRSPSPATSPRPPTWPRRRPSTRPRSAGACAFTAPLRVYHVVKVPDLDIQGLEGVIKQYVGVWKGKRITANFPFKVEFQVAVETQPKPVKLFVHLREDEFEYID
ncbi:hypothetical protein ACQ4PT_007630 [Festuca glaucescens]